MGYVQLPHTWYTNERAPKMAWLELWRVRYSYRIREGGTWSEAERRNPQSVEENGVYVLCGQRNIRIGRGRQILRRHNPSYPASIKQSSAESRHTAIGDLSRAAGRKKVWELSIKTSNHLKDHRASMPIS